MYKRQHTLAVMLVQQLEVQINLDQVLVLLVVVQEKFDLNKVSFLLKDRALHVAEKVQALKTHVLNVLELEILKNKKQFQLLYLLVLIQVQEFE